MTLPWILNVSYLDKSESIAEPENEENPDRPRTSGPLSKNLWIRKILTNCHARSIKSLSWSRKVPKVVFREGNIDGIYRRADTCKIPAQFTAGTRSTDEKTNKNKFFNLKFEDFILQSTASNQQIHRYKKCILWNKKMAKVTLLDSVLNNWYNLRRRIYLFHPIYSWPISQPSVSKIMLLQLKPQKIQTDPYFHLNPVPNLQPYCNTLENHTHQLFPNIIKAQVRFNFILTLPRTIVLICEEITHTKISIQSSVNVCFAAAVKRCRDALALESHHRRQLSFLPSPFRILIAV